jgi:hypothetical protein
VFAPQLTWKVNGTAKFGQRAMILTMETNQRIEFRYLAILGITMEDGMYQLDNSFHILAGFNGSVDETSLNSIIHH